MKDEHRVITNTLLAYGTRVVAALVGFLMVPYLLHQLGREQYGAIGIFSALLSLGLLIDLGLRPATTRQLTSHLQRGDPQVANEVVSTAMAAYSALALAVGLAIALGGRAFLDLMQVSAELRPDALVVLAAVAAMFAFRLVRTPYEAALASQIRFDVHAYIEAGAVIARALLIVAVFTLWEPRLAVWGLAAAAVLAPSVLLLRSQAHRLSPTLRVSRRLVTRRGARELAGFSAYTSLQRLAVWLGEQTGPLIISFFLGSAAVALYAPAALIALQLRPLSQAFLAQLPPVVTRAQASGHEEQIRRIVLRSARYALLVSGGAHVLLASLAFALVPVWLGAGFERTAWVLVLWCAAGVLQAAVGGAWPFFVGTGRLRGAAYLNVALALAAVALSVHLVGATGMGVLGPAVALAGSQLVRTLVYAVWTTRGCGIAAPEYARESLLGPAVCLGGLAACALAVPRLLDAAPIVELTATAALALPTYAALVWAIGLSHEDRTKALSYAEEGWSRVLAIASRLRSPGG